MATPQEAGAPTPEGIFSLLDTDLYKLTMQCAVLKFFPNHEVAYAFTNRTPDMKLSRGAYKWLQDQIDKLGNLMVTREELGWLKTTCPYLSQSYLDYLKGFRLRPKEQVELSFAPTGDSDDDSVPGNISLTIRGLWVETIAYEIPLLALISEAYFKFVDRDWNHDGQSLASKTKATTLLQQGCNFSEFGSRRRRDYRTHDMVIQGLVDAQQEAKGKDWSGRCLGTSNVHLAMKHGIAPSGTVAHEWFMGIAAIENDYAHANEKAMLYWTRTFGRGVLSVALTDTFGTPNFLQAFARPVPQEGTADAADERGPTYAEIFTGVRQDSGDPKAFVARMTEFYASQGIADEKLVVFSDSLNVDRCIEYGAVARAAGLTPSFGIGTFFTNDFARAGTPGEKSVPLNIVIKLSEAGGRPAVKLSDNRGKNMGDEALVREIKRIVGYEEREWEGADEAHRWDR